jgi:integrase
MAKRLTPIGIEKVKPGSKRIEIPDAARPGLYLVVQPTGRKSWAFRYRRKSDGKSRKLSFPFVSLAEAHKLAQAALDKVASGGDPASKDGDGSKLYGDVMEQFIARYLKANCKASTATEVARMLAKDTLPYWRDRDIRSIGKADVLDVLDRIVDRGGHITANRTLAAMKGLFGWSVERGLIEVSPAAKVKKPSGENQRDRVLSDEEARLVWNVAGEESYPFGSVVQLLLLTGQRLGEVAGMQWDELDLDKKEWRLPLERTKNSKPHLVPLSDAAMAVIKSVPPVDARFVFSAVPGKSIVGFAKIKHRLDRVTGIEGWVLHDLRRTVATGLQKLGVALPVTESVLNHASGSRSGIVGVYQRHDYADEKRKALDAWASFILAEPANVVAFRA